MKKVTTTSPDGRTTLSEVTHDGVTFHLPPWISEEEFIAGLDSSDDGEPLSSLVGCTVAGWEKEYDDELDQERDYPIFEVQFKLPFNSAREIALNRFTPRGTTLDWRGNLEQEFTVLEDGVLVEFYATEYTDFNDVQIFVLPSDFREKSFPGNDQWVEEYFNELSENFEPALRKRLYWDGLDEEFAAAGLDYFLISRIHED